MTNRVVESEPIKEKLRDLPSDFCSENEYLHAFGEYLSDRLNPYLTGIVFLNTANYALRDLERGVDSRNNSAIESILVGLPSEIYNSLGEEIWRIAAATCPETIAKEVLFWQTFNSIW